jgi:hypothetical protein
MVSPGTEDRQCQFVSYGDPTLNHRHLEQPLVVRTHPPAPMDHQAERLPRLVVVRMMKVS